MFMIKYLSIIATSIFVFVADGCTGMKIKSSMKPKNVYDQVSSDTERIKVSYLHYRSCKTFSILIYQKNNLVNSFEIKDCPNRFGIDKRNAADKNVNYTYRLVTDTLQNQFKCIDYFFLPQYCNAATMKTFIPISEREKAFLKTIPKIIQEGDYKFSLTVEDIEKFIGWVKIPY